MGTLRRRPAEEIFREVRVLGGLYPQKKGPFIYHGGFFFFPLFFLGAGFFVGVGPIFFPGFRRLSGKSFSPPPPTGVFPNFLGPPPQTPVFVPFLGPVFFPRGVPLKGPLFQGFSPPGAKAFFFPFWPPPKRGSPPFKGMGPQKAFLKARNPPSKNPPKFSRGR